MYVIAFGRSKLRKLLGVSITRSRHLDRPVRKHLVPIRWCHDIGVQAVPYGTAPKSSVPPIRLAAAEQIHGEE